jgi:UDP-glucose 4-epimerase
MILLTGATGYIGSHTWIELLKSSEPVIGIDNLSNSRVECLDAISKISGKIPTFFKGDIRDSKFLAKIFADFQVTYVIHLAGLKDVGESTTKKDEYFDVNVRGLECLIKVMRSHGCNKIIFSSSAAIYGGSALSPITELTEVAPSNYYGQTKLDGENLLAKEFHASPPIYSVILRYFNVAGRDSSGLIGDYSLSKTFSLFTEIESVLNGAKSNLSIYGDDWGTEDGTCIRDYLHVSDLAKGHIDSLALLDTYPGFNTLNLGTGVGHSVREVIFMHETATGMSIPSKVVSRRVGDIGISYSDISHAKKVIKWHPLRKLSDMCTFIKREY